MPLRMRKAAISAQLIGASTVPDKRAHQVVATIEGDLFARGWPEGELLGTLTAFKKRFRLGYRSCGEAIAIMKARGLVNVRRGAAGGLYVSRPSLNQIVDQLLLHILLRGTRSRCVLDTRWLVHGTIVGSLLHAGIRIPHPPPRVRFAADKDFPLWLARLTGNPGIVFMTELIEEVYGRCCDAAGPAPRRLEPLSKSSRHRSLIEAINGAQAARAQMLAAELAGSHSRLNPEDPVALESVDRAGWLDRCGGPGRLAARLIRDVAGRNQGELARFGSEEQIAKRYGFNTEVVRQALRILENMGMVECHQGWRGGLLQTRPQEGALVRLIYPRLAAGNVSAPNAIEILSFLASSIPGLAAARVRNGEALPLLAQLFSHRRMNSDPAADADWLAAENLLLDLAGNPILSVLVRSVALCYLASERFERHGTLPAQALAALADCNARIFAAIQQGDVDAAALEARRKDEFMRLAVAGNNE